MVKRSMEIRFLRGGNVFMVARWVEEAETGVEGEAEICGVVQS